MNDDIDADFGPIADIDSMRRTGIHGQLVVQHFSRAARVIRVFGLWMPLVSGCARSHAPPFADVPYQGFSRAAVVTVAMRGSGGLFGAPVNDDDHLNWDKPERNEGL